MSRIRIGRRIRSSNAIICITLDLFFLPALNTVELKSFGARGAARSGEWNWGVLVSDIQGSDLSVDGRRLRAVSARITSVESSVRFTGALNASVDGVLGSSEVGSALRDGARQQEVRAGAVAAALHAVGGSPEQAAVSFADADARLAGVF